MNNTQKQICKFLQNCTVLSYENTQIQLVNNDTRIIINTNKQRTKCEIVFASIEDENIYFAQTFEINK